mmetsp:Transcript_25592/g.48455  ORF Transcript_25592/g.48455 Transcript_25592/m.48455 type:complete len:672 (+) Transcript_25592:207-2222(+)
MASLASRRCFALPPSPRLLHPSFSTRGAVRTTGGRSRARGEGAAAPGRVAVIARLPDAQPHRQHHVVERLKKLAAPITLAAAMLVPFVDEAALAATQAGHNDGVAPSAVLVYLLLSNVVGYMTGRSINDNSAHFKGIIAELQESLEVQKASTRDLHSKLHRAEKDLSNEQGTNSLLSSEVNTAKHALAAERDLATSLEEKMGSLRKKLDVSQAKADSLNSTLQANELTLKTVQKEAKKEAKSKEQGLLKIVELEQQVQELKNSNQQLRREVAAAEAEASAATHNFATATGKLVELEEQLSELSDTEQGVAAALHASLARSEGEVASAQSEVADLKAEVQKLTSQVEHANGQLAAKQAELEGSASKMESLVLEIEGLKTQDGNLTNDLMNTKAELKTTKADYETTHAELASVNSALTETEQLLSSVKTENVDLAARLESLTSSTEGLKGVQDELKLVNAQLAAAQEELGSTQAEKTKLQAALDEAMAATKPAEAEMDAVKQMMGELNLKNKDLAQQIKSLQEDDMNALRRSSQEKLGSAFPNKDFVDINRRELTKVKAYLNYKSRGVQNSTKEEQVADWKNAMIEVEAMAEAGFTEVDFLAEFCRVSAILVNNGDWSIFTVGDGDNDSDVRRNMLGHVLEFFSLSVLEAEPTNSFESDNEAKSHDLVGAADK